MTEADALQQLHEILARPEYRDEASRPWWEQLLASLLDLLRYVLERLVVSIANASSGREGWIGFAVLALCAVLFAVVGLYLVRAVRISVRRETTARAQSVAQRRERSERLWQTAQQLAASGQWQEAVRVVYLSALYALDERALLHVETSLTNREHARELRRLHPEVAGTFAEVVERYDELRYGGTQASSEAFEALSQRVARARSAALGGAVAA